MKPYFISEEFLRTTEAYARAVKTYKWYLASLPRFTGQQEYKQVLSHIRTVKNLRDTLIHRSAKLRNRILG